jgi:hypothetical protein
VKRENHKNEYHKEYYFNKKLFDGVELVAKMERTRKKKSAGDYDEGRSFRLHGGKLTEYLK